MRIRSTNGRPMLGPRDVPRWNFHKYLIGRDGNIAEVFPETVEPTGYARENRHCARAGCGLTTPSARN